MIKKFICYYILLISFISHSQSKDRERLAILDFKIIANEKDTENFKWLELGFAETLTDAFSRIPEFLTFERSQISKILEEQKFQSQNIVDTTSIARVGKILGVNSVIIGSCQIYTGHMMINMRLVNVETGEIQPISNPIIGPINNVLQLQKDMCIAILSKYGITRSNDKIEDLSTVTIKSTKNFLAYEFLSKGIEFYNNDQYPEALLMFDRSLAEDKKYGKAYYKKGVTNMALNKFAEAANNFERADEYLRKDSIYVLMSNAYMKEGDIKKSIDFLERAKKLNPENSYLNSKLFQLKNTSDEFVREDEIKTIYEFKNGIAKVKGVNKYGYIDLDNNIIIPLIFEDLGEFKNGLARIKVNSKWGFINIKGEFVVPPIYNYVKPYDIFNMATVQVKEKWGMINEKGEVIIPIDFENSTYDNSWNESSLIIVWKYKGYFSNESVYGVYDRKGNQIVPLEYDRIYKPYRPVIINMEYFENEYPYLHASKNDKWGVLNNQNEVVVPFVYDSYESIRPFKNEYAAVKINEKWGFVDTKGILVVNPIYERVDDYEPPYVKVKIREKWGVINIEGKEILPCEFLKLNYIEKGYWAAKMDDYWGILDSNNKEICSFIYDNIGNTMDGYTSQLGSDSDDKEFVIQVKKDGKKFWVNDKCECIYNCK